MIWIMYVDVGPYISMVSDKPFQEKISNNEILQPYGVIQLRTDVFQARTGFTMNTTPVQYIYETPPVQKNQQRRWPPWGP